MRRRRSWTSSRIAHHVFDRGQSSAREGSMYVVLGSEKGSFGCRKARWKPGSRTRASVDEKAEIRSANWKPSPWTVVETHALDVG